MKIQLRDEVREYENGTTVLQIAESISEGLARVEMNGKWGYIDREGNVVIPFKYDGAEDFSEGLAEVLLKNKYSFIDKKGKEIIRLQAKIDKMQKEEDKLKAKLEKVKGDAPAKKTTTRRKKAEKKEE